MSPSTVLDAPFLSTVSPTTALFILLIALTMVLYTAFMHYALAGSIWVAWSTLRGRATGVRPDRIAVLVREWLPFAVSGAITAGIAPLLFVQVIYQGSFYTANLLLFNGWMAILPALILAMWMLYLSKAHGTLAGWIAKATAATLAAGLMVFVACMFVENHLVSLNPSAWVTMYATGEGGPSASAVWSRLLMWVGMSFTTLAALVAGQELLGACGSSAADRASAARPLAIMAWSGLAFTVAAAGWHAQADGDAERAWLSVAARPYAWAALTGAGVALVAWAMVFVQGTLSAATVVSALAGSLVLLVGAAMIREVQRLADLAGTPAAARSVTIGGGAVVFAVSAATGLITIVWIVVQVRRALNQRANDS